MLRIVFGVDSIFKGAILVEKYLTSMSLYVFLICFMVLIRVMFVCFICYLILSVDRAR